MPDAHDLAVLGPGGDLQVGRYRLRQDHQRVVPRGRERIGQAGEDALTVVADLRRLAVHLRLRARHRATKRLADRLVTQTDAQDGRVSAQAVDDLQRDPGLVGGPGAGRDHDALGLQRRDAVDVEGVVADDVRLRAQLAEVLDEVVGERVVVVDDENHPSGPAAAMRRARIIPRAFEHVSSHSVLGSESATMPAPTWIEARLPWQTIVRIVMQESRFPEYEMYPTAPAYGPRRVGSISSMISIARILGAPVTVPAGKHARRTSKASAPRRSVPTTWLTRCMTCEYRSVAMNSVTLTEPSSATRPTSLRPRSTSMTCSARSLGSLCICASIA